MSVSQIRRALLILLLLLTSCGAFCRASLSLCRIRAFELGKRIAHFTKWADVSRLLHFPKCSIRLPISWNRQFYRLGVTYALIIVCCVTCICRTQALTQKKALRIMTGQANTTPVEALSAESGICRYRTADHSPTESDQLWSWSLSDGEWSAVSVRQNLWESSQVPRGPSKADCIDGRLSTSVTQIQLAKTCYRAADDVIIRATEPRTSWSHIRSFLEN